MDHDNNGSRQLIQVSFGLCSVLPRLASGWKYGSVEWSRQGGLPGISGRPAPRLDLVASCRRSAKWPAKRPGEPEQWRALVHIEIESPERTTPLRPRIVELTLHLAPPSGFCPCCRPAFFCAWVLERARNCRFTKEHLGTEDAAFEYLYVGFAAGCGRRNTSGTNWWGSRWRRHEDPKQPGPWLGAEALSRIRPLRKRFSRGFVGEKCVQTYRRLDEAQQREFEALVQRKPYAGVQAMNTTWLKRHRKRAAFGLRELLEDQFGPLSSTCVAKMTQLQPGALPPLQKALTARIPCRNW